MTATLDIERLYDAVEGVTPIDGQFGDIVLWPHQREAVAAVEAEFAKGVRSTLVVIPTGGGKTSVFGAIAIRRVERGGRVLILAHRGELITQAVERVAAMGQIAAIEKAEQRMEDFAGLLGDPKIVVGCVPTMRGKRLLRVPPDHFDLVIIDECFPAGTMIGDRRIESLRVGDFVPTAVNGRVERRIVTKTFRSRPSAMVRITFDDGRSLACTANHPVSTIHGFFPASTLKSGDMVHSIMHAKNHHLGGVSGVFQGHGVLGGSAVSREGGAPVLLNRMHEGGDSAAVGGEHGENEQEVRLGEDEGEKPDGESAVAKEDVHDSSRHGMEAEATRRQWKASSRSATTAGVRARMGDRIPGADGEVEDERVPDLLQNRHRELFPEDWHRSGWQQSLLPEGSGRKENQAAGISRVDRVEVLQPGRDGTFGGVCQDGFVYNLEVDDTNTYFADGILVHNCHHAPGATYAAIIAHFAHAQILGVTATPDRGDEVNIGGVFESCAFQYPLDRAIRESRLSRIQVARLETGIDLSKIRTTAGDLNAGDLEVAISANMETLVNATRQEMGRRCTMVFTPDVGSAELFAAGLNRVGVSAMAVSGKCSDQERSRILAEFRAGKFQALCNCALLLEGYDNPNVDCIVCARPTKSRPLYTQMLGRGTRYRNGKDYCLLIDFTYNSGKHELVNPVELFADSSASPEIVTIAEELVKDGTKKDILEALEAAKEIHDERQVRRVRMAEEKLRVEKRKAEYRRIMFDPVGAGEVIGVQPTEDAAPWQRKPASPGQVQFLEKAGIPNPQGLTFGQAERTIDAIRRRRREDKATYKQVRALIKLGMDADVARDLGFREASEAMSAAAANGWKLPGAAPAEPQYKAGDVVGDGVLI
jgi:superfamily II DNA or RNA helicase